MMFMNVLLGNNYLLALNQDNKLHKDNHQNNVKVVV